MTMQRITSMIDLPSKLALVLFLSVCAFTLPWQISAGLCLLVIIGRYFVPQLRPLSDRSAKAFSRFILYSLVVATLVVLLNAALIRGGSYIIFIHSLNSR